LAYTIRKSCADMDWNAVCRVIEGAGLAVHSPETTKKAFSNSFVTVFIYEANSLIAVGRAIYDGVYQAAIYDIAVLPSYQGRKIGKLVLEEIHKELIGWMYYYFVCKSGEGRLLSTAWL